MKARRPERDYSHRSLADKLGLARGQRVACVNVAGHDFPRLIAGETGTQPAAVLRGRFDRIFLQVDGPRDLAKIAGAAAHLEPDGALWILHPKGKDAAVKEGQLRDAYLACGLVDNKISAYTQTYTATRCVIPLARRGRG